LFAQAPDSDIIFSPGPVTEVAVPRAIDTWETIEAPDVPVVLPEPSPDVAIPVPISEGASAAGAAGRSQQPAVEVPIEPRVPQDGDRPPLRGVREPIRQVRILGIDRTQFPDIMVVFGLRDEVNRPITDPIPAFLEVTEDEAPQKFYDFAPVVPGKLPGEPLTLMMLIDSSGSMQQYIDVVQNAAARFVEKLQEDDRAGVVAFCDQPVVLEELTTDKERITRGIYQLQPRGFTALYDSLYLGAMMLRNAPGKRAIVLVTDGKDDDGAGRQLSRRSLNQAMKACDDNNIPVFAIGLGKDISQTTLREMAEATGGEFLFAPRGEDVDDLYSEVARSLDRGDEGYYKVNYRATQSEKDNTARTVVVRYKNSADRARYPAPRNWIWPISKVIP
jgi:VWFA-related protein